MLAGLVPSGGSEIESDPCLSPASGGLVAVLDVPRLVIVSLQSLPLSSCGPLHGVSPGLHMASFKDTSHWI